MLHSFANAGFAKITGYSVKHTIDKNCRYGSEAFAPERAHRRSHRIIRSSSQVFGSVGKGQGQ